MESAEQGYKKNSENSSVRVRRLLKQDVRNSMKVENIVGSESAMQVNPNMNSNIATTGMSNMSAYSNMTINSTTNQITMATEFRKNLYDSIKEEIREGLRK